MHLHISGDRAHHLECSSLVGDAARQIHQTAAFGISRHAVLNPFFDLFAQAAVGFQFCSAGLGKSAADIQPVDIGKVRIAQRIERHKLGARRLERIQIVGIIKPESLIAGNRNAHLILDRQRNDLGLVRHIEYFLVGKGKQPLEVNLLGDRLADLLDLGRCNMGFIAGHQPQVALHNGEPFIVMNRPHHRHIGIVLNHRAQLGLMATAAQVVQEHAGDVDVAIECLITQDQRCNPARHAARIDHQKYRKIEHLRERRIAVAAIQRQTIVQPLVALHQIHLCKMAGKSGNDIFIGHQIQVEVAARPACRLRQPHGIDVIRAFFVGLHGMATRLQCGAQTYADHRLA